MLKCKDVAEHASSYIDHSLPWPQRVGWIIHLTFCNHCRRFVRHLRLAINIGSRIGQTNIPLNEAKAISERAIQKSVASK